MIPLKSSIVATALASSLAMAPSVALAQQVLIPTAASQVPGPPSGTAMTTAYVQSVGRMAYLWGWPLVNMANRGAGFSKLPEPVLIGGVFPIGYNANAI